MNQNTIISPDAHLSPLADIEESTKGTKVIISARCMIDSFVKIKTAGGLGDVFIDEDSYINSGTVIYSGNGVKIGKKVLVAANCTFAPVNHCFDDRLTPIKDQGFKESRGGIIVEDDVWIGSNVVLLDGAHVSKGVVIAAGTIVKGTIPEYAIIGGNPWQVIRYRN